MACASALAVTHADEVRAGSLLGMSETPATSTEGTPVA
jgi:hypothetical protein